MKTIVFITTGQPSTNPRMIKEYMTLKKEGYNIKVIYSYWTNWALKTDEDYFKAGELHKEDFILAGGTPYIKKCHYFLTRLFHKFFKTTVSFIPSFTKWTIARPSYALYLKAISTYADLYIAHNPGALPAAFMAAKKNKSKLGFDAEDFHRGEHFDQSSPDALAVKYIEDEYLPQCDYITAASPMIGNAYKKLYPSQKIVVINNVFSKKYLQKIHKESHDHLRLFWFSQTIGPHRGLETAVKAIEILKGKCKIELHLMGNVLSGYSSQLIKLTTHSGFIHFIPPVAPDRVFEQASKFDVGLSLEVPETENRDYCLTNKLFTYLMSGNCVIFSDTSAQKDFIESYPGIGYLVDADNEIKLSEILFCLHNNREKLYEKRFNSLRVAAQYLNWEEEAQKFQAIIEEQLR